MFNYLNCYLFNLEEVLWVLILKSWIAIIVAKFGTVNDKILLNNGTKFVGLDWIGFSILCAQILKLLHNFSCLQKNR